MPGLLSWKERCHLLVRRGNDRALAVGWGWAGKCSATLGAQCAELEHTAEPALWLDSGDWAPPSGLEACEHAPAPTLGYPDLNATSTISDDLLTHVALGRKATAPVPPLLPALQLDVGPQIPDTASKRLRSAGTLQVLPRLSLSLS